MNLTNFEKDFKQAINDLWLGCTNIQNRLFSVPKEDEEKEAEDYNHRIYMENRLVDLKGIYEIAHGVYIHVCDGGERPQAEREKRSELYNEMLDVIERLCDINLDLEDVRDAFVGSDPALGEEPKEQTKPLTYEDLCADAMSEVMKGLALVNQILEFISKTKDDHCCECNSRGTR